MAALDASFLKRDVFIWPGKNNSDQTCILAPLGIMGDPIEDPITTQRYRIEGFEVRSSIVPPLCRGLEVINAGFVFGFSGILCRDWRRIARGVDVLGRLLKETSLGIMGD